MGVTQSFAGLLVCRFFLGLFEAGFLPGQLNQTTTRSPAQTKLRLPLLVLYVLQAP